MKKYDIIFRDFKNSILNGQYMFGDRLPTEEEISSIYGTSRVPVQQAMNALKSAGYVNRKAGVGTTVTFQSSMDKKINKKTVFLLNELNSETAEITEGIQSVLHESGIFVSVRYSYGKPEIDRQLLNQLSEGEIGGLIMYESSSDANIDLIYDLIVKHAPLVLVDNLPNDIICNCVMSDPVQAMYGIVEHLYNKGHRRIAIMTHQLNKKSNANIRLKMMRTAMSSFGLELPDEYIKSRQMPSEEIPELMLLPEPPTALIFTATVLMTECVEIFNKLDIHIPEDLSVIVHDNIPRFFDFFGMKFTSVSQNYFEIGAVSAQRLYDFMINPDDGFRIDYIPTDFVEGDSVSELGIGLTDDNNMWSGQ